VRAPKPRSTMYKTYWGFASKRHGIFESRLAGDPNPWTDDPILQTNRFCNSFRAADRVTQHLIGVAAYGHTEADEADLFLRIALARIFSRPSTWQLLEDRLGPITANAFNQDRYDQVLEEAIQGGVPIYTGAFILSASPSFGHSRKHRNHLALLDAMLKDGVPAQVAQAKRMSEVFYLLRGWPLLGDFMAYQLAIDLNYSVLTDFSEDDFTVPGPGAVRGIKKLFESLNDYSPADAIHWLVDQQEHVEEQFGVAPPSLFGRPLHAIDCQNLLCEVDKYCREAFPAMSSNRSRIKQRFAPDHTPLRLFFPPGWGINQNVSDQWRLDVHRSASV
jgi:5-hmdU DNA kinase-like protein